MSNSSNATLKDVGSIEAIVAALYDTISGPAGADRDWDRLRRLFYAGARLLRTEVSAEIGIRMATMTVDEFITVATPYFVANPFYEREVFRRVDCFGQIAQVFSTYEASSEPNRQGPLGRGINSIQLWFDGTRWWVMSMLWDDERARNPIPPQYLP